MNFVKNWKPLHQGNVLVYQWKGPEADKDLSEEFPYFAIGEIGYSMHALRFNPGRMKVKIAGNGATIFQKDPYIKTFIRGIEWGDFHKIVSLGTDLETILKHRNSIRKKSLLVSEPIMGEELIEFERNLSLREHMLNRVARESSSKQQFMYKIQWQEHQDL